ncbi:phosphoketolase family protein [Shimazuella sp. AN120528]|uniref:phosphoketolase family protein n=1 Tax=Shimazuella soli TaxID=1892854 RepID=UPI001F0FA9B2|nr:phosphoketolase family protein [Shimazuella soli]MCH5584860.1 phosphoketolase family protein [Shimazuella soli]
MNRIKVEIRNQIDSYVRTANYLTVSQLYLCDNFLLTEHLQKKDIKARSFGHWGNAPAINFIFGHLNYLLTCNPELNILPVVGTGHSGPAILANLFLEGTLSEFDPFCTPDIQGIAHLSRTFATPSGFPTELSSKIPGCIHPGGELGHALSVAFGAVLDNSETLAVCILGDGECETGPTAAAWHGAKFLSPTHSGAVLPIINLNGYKMSSQSLLSMMSETEIESYFFGLDYEVQFVSGTHTSMEQALDWAVTQIAYKRKNQSRSRWPLLILRTPKGWTGPKSVDGRQIAGTAKAHKAPLQPLDNPADFIALESWLQSYLPHELFDEWGQAKNLKKIVPPQERRLGKTLDTIQRANQKIQIHFPDPVSLLGNAKTSRSPAKHFGQFLSQILVRNEAKRAIRVFSPDELNSNQLHSLLDVTMRNNGSSQNRDGSVLEILSEHVCQGWSQGYVLSGKQAWFTSYECFISTVTSALSQYIKYLVEAPDWQGSWPSLNYFLTSLAWQNNYSHQNPEFTQLLIAKYGSKVRLYFPPDTLTLLECTKVCMQSNNLVNVVTAGKTALPSWTTSTQAKMLASKGVAILEEFSHSESPDLIFAASGDYVTNETIKAIQLLKEYLPDIYVRFVSVCEITCLGSSDHFTHALASSEFENLFTEQMPVIFAFNGYPATIQTLLFERPNPSRFTVLGYKDEGTTTSFLGMCIRNGVSRYHLVIKSIDILAKKGIITSSTKETIQKKCNRRIQEYLSSG